jgi:hypothetical protein
MLMPGRNRKGQFHGGREFVTPGSPAIRRLAPNGILGNGSCLIANGLPKIRPGMNSTLRMGGGPTERPLAIIPLIAARGRSGDTELGCTDGRCC